MLPGFRAVVAVGGINQFRNCQGQPINAHHQVLWKDWYK
jgi:hypothetical protein